MEDKIRFIVNEKCNYCGMCSMQYPEYFTETDEGKAQTYDRVVKLDESVVSEVEELCPVHAITTEKESKSTRQLLAEEIEKLKECRVEFPTKDDIPFKKEEYSIPIPIASGEHRYEYSSDSSANSAARSEFNNKMYSQIDALILKVITEYRVRYIKPYYSKSNEDNSVYLSCNKKAEAILADIVNILHQERLDDDLPINFGIVDCFPKEDTVWKMLNKGELLSDEMVSSIKSEFKSQNFSELSNYETYWDTDSMERPSGSDFRGRTKYKDKYCYKNMNEAFRELAKDLLDACCYKDDYIIERAVDLVKGFIVEYNDKLEQSLKERIAYIEKKMDYIQADVAIPTVTLDAYPKFMRKVVHYKDKPICVNGVETNDKEVFIVDANNGSEQFFYDGKVIKKRFVSNGIVKNEVILKDMQPKYDRIVGYNEQIIFDHDDCLWRYDCKKDACDKIVKNIFRLYIYKDVLIYTICDNLPLLGKSSSASVRMDSSGSIWCSSFDGKAKAQLKSFGYGNGLIFVDLVNDEKIFYSVVGSKNQEGSVEWKLNSFLPADAELDKLYTDFEITEECKQQKLAAEKSKAENEVSMIEALQVGDIKEYWKKYIENYDGDCNHKTIGGKPDNKQYSEQEICRKMVSQAIIDSIFTMGSAFDECSEERCSVEQALVRHLYKENKLDMPVAYKYVGYLMDNGISICDVFSFLYRRLTVIDRKRFQYIVDDMLHQNL